jgi:hypothetical protein
LGSFGNAGISAGAVANDISIAVINTLNGNEVFVAFSDESNSDRLTIMRWGGTSWTTEGTAGSHSTSNVTSLSITAADNNDLFVAYNDFGFSGKVSIKKDLVLLGQILVDQVYLQLQVIMLMLLAIKITYRL